MKYTFIIISLLISVSGFGQDPRLSPTTPHLVFTQDNITKFLEIGTANQQLVVNPSATGFLWTDPGGLSANSVDSTHVINGGLSLDDLSSGGAADGAALQYDALTGWGPSTGAILTGIGATGRMAYYTSAQTMGNVPGFTYTESGNNKHMQVRGTGGQSRIGGSSSTGELFIESISTGSPDIVPAGAINLRKAAGSFDSPSNLGVNNVLFGGIYVYPYVNSAYRLNGGLYFQGDGTASGNNYSTKLLIQTNPGNAASATRMEVGSDGQITFNAYTSSSAFPGTTSHFVTQNSSGEFLTKGAAVMMSELITGDIDLESNRITSLANAQVGSDAVNKTQLDSVGTIVGNYHSLDLIAGVDGDTIVLDTEETLLVLDGALGDPATFYIDGSGIASGSKVFIKYGGFSSGATLDRDDDNDPGNFLATGTTSGSTTLVFTGTGTAMLLKSGATWYQMY